VTTPSKIDKYEFRKGICRFACPRCAELLNTQVADADKIDTCPACNLKFTSPGDAELSELREKQKAEAIERHVAEQRKKDLQAKITEQRRQEKAQKLAAQQKESETAFSQQLAMDVKTHTVPVTNLSYPALETYKSLLKAFAYVMVILWGFGTLASATIAFRASRLIEARNPIHRDLSNKISVARSTLAQLEIGTDFGDVEGIQQIEAQKLKILGLEKELESTPENIPRHILESIQAAIAGMIPAVLALPIVLVAVLLLLVFCEIIQLAMDARFDIARLANGR
jgi:Zn-finger nucleic acid-binding protein